PQCLSPLVKNKSPCQTLADKRVNDRAELSKELLYRSVTTSVALPPLLLRTVMLCGLTACVNSPRNLPPPSFESVPISWPLEVTKTCKVAVATVLVASTLSLRLPAWYSARVIATESGAGVASGLTVKFTVRVVPPAAPCNVATVRDS